jgi:uncharacterized protein (DUF488 family)
MPQYCVYTVGHGTEDWDSFARRLQDFSIEVLLDVRTLPYVECSWFNRDRLEGNSRKKGWEYLWLGGKLGPLTEDGRLDYLAKEREKRYQDGIVELMNLAAERTVCLLSSQLDPLDSHRHHLIAQTLMRHDIGVLHIMENGEKMYAQADLFHGLPG